MKKMLYIGHAYHNKTQSSSFIKELLAQKYDMEYLSYDPYQDKLEQLLISLKGRKYDFLVCWQIMPNIKKLKHFISFKTGVFFPMYDGAPSRKDKIWLEYAKFHIINFSKTLHEELTKLGFCSHYFQYFPKPEPVEDFGDENSIFFWQRVRQININTLERLFDPDEVKHIHLHKAIDPGHTFTEPSAEWKDKISYSEWFENKSDMTDKIKDAAIYIAPRLYEGIGMSFLEAMAMGRCVVSPNKATMNEYIENGKTGILYDLSAPHKVDLTNIRQIQKNAYKYIEEGYENWCRKQYDILKIIEMPVKSAVKKNDFDGCKRTKYYLFGFLPILTIKEEKGKKKYNLLGIVPALKIKEKAQSKKIYLFGVPVVKTSTKEKKESFYYKLMKKASKVAQGRNRVLLVDNIFESHANIQDNFTFFKYLYNCKDKTLKPYYLLNRESPYYEQLKKKYGEQIVPWTKDAKTSLSSKIMFLMFMLKTRFVCDSFQSVASFPGNFAMFARQSKYITLIFMQHGITFFKPDFITPNVYGANIFDKVLVSNDREKNLFLDRGKFVEDNIIKNGLVRWDEVKNLSKKEKEKSIFVFFTTRRYLSKIKNIEDSQYVKEIMSILQNKMLAKKLNAKKITLKIALHHSIAKVIKPILDKYGVQLVSEEDIFRVKQEASLLLTDYSSMCFEFFLQGKPVIFYQLDDAQDCLKYGHTVDVADPFTGKEELLSNITKNKDDLVNLLSSYIDKKFKLTAEDEEKQNRFFYYRKDFCQRMKEYLENIQNVTGKGYK